MTEARTDTRVPLEAEKRELEALLASGILSRAPNLQNFLEFVCQQYFEGKAGELKEYSVAVAALHRGEDFNPQADTIVRVSAHSLRRRLDQYYREEGLLHAVHIVLPPGSYAPRFVYSGAPQNGDKDYPAPAVESPSDPPVQQSILEERAWWRSPRSIGIALATILLIAVAIILLQRTSKDFPGAGQNVSRRAEPVATMVTSANAIRFLPGRGRAPVVDVGGQSWASDTFCSGGGTFSHPDEVIAGTDDPELFNSGRIGRMRCMLPVPAGDYELHLFFADTFHGQEATRQVGYVVNSAKAQTIDVVDEAGGSNTATERLYTDVHPAADGKIHLDFVTDDSFINAVELVPGVQGVMMPLRLLAGRAAYHDQQHQVWLPDRFFSGGRRTYRADGLPSVVNPGLFQYERFGHFSYRLPVIPGRDYSLTLYFEEGWYGRRNGGTGGAGSRVFDIYCNGNTLLTNLDILKENPDGYVVKTFHHLKPTAQGKLELYFTPVTNYPLVDALEVEQESPLNSLPQ